MATCPKCKERERARGQAWCRVCLTEYQRERRARAKVLVAADLGGEIVVGCPRCAGRAMAVGAAFDAFVSDPVVRQAMARVPFLKLRTAIMEILGGPNGG